MLRRAIWFALSPFLLAEAVCKGDCPSVLNSGPDLAAALRAVAVCESRSGHLDRATASFRRLAELEPNAWQAWNNLGANYLEVKKPNEATEALRKSARLNPRAVSALFNLATALSQLEKHSEAFQAIDHAQRAAGDD